MIEDANNDVPVPSDLGGDDVDDVASDLEALRADMELKITTLETMIRLQEFKLAQMEKTASATGDAVDAVMSSLVPQAVDPLPDSQDNDWTHPDSQFETPTTKSVEQEYDTATTGDRKTDMLRVYQFKTPTDTPTVDTTSKALVRTVVGSVPTLVYPTLTEVTVLAGSPSINSSGQWIFPTKKLKVILAGDGVGADVNGPALQRATVVEDVNVSTPSGDGVLQQRKYDTFLVSPATPTNTYGGVTTPISTIEDCD